jgi:hypothetical protein
LVVGLACLLFASAADAAPEWSAPVTVGAGPNIESIDVALDPQGDAAAVWRSGVNAEGTIGSAFKPAGSNWQSPITLSGPVQGAFEPQVAIDEAGEAIAVWDAWLGREEQVIQVSTRPAGGNWSAPLDLSRTDEGAARPDLSMNERGEAAISWQAHPSGWNVVQVAQRSVLGSWSPPEEIAGRFGPANSNAPEPQVAMDPEGDVALAWQNFEVSEGVVDAAVKQAGSPWSPPTQMASPTGYGACEPQVAMGPHGEATVAWISVTFGARTVESSIKLARGAWTLPVQHSKFEYGQEAYGLEMAPDPASDGIVAWEMWRYGHFDVQIGPANQGLFASSTVARFADSPEVASSPAGAPVAVWTKRPEQEREGESPVIEGAFDPGPSSPFQLSSQSESSVRTPQIAVNDAGEAAAAWRSGPEQDSVVKAAILQSPAVVIGPTPPASSSPPNSWSGPSGDTRSVPKSHLAMVVGAGRVEGSTLRLALRCPATILCKGNVKILAPHRVAAGRGKAQGSVILGSERFSVGPGKTRPIHVRLVRAALQAIDAAPRHRLKVNIVGKRVEPRTLVLASRKLKGKLKRSSRFGSFDKPQKVPMVAPKPVHAAANRP